MPSPTNNPSPTPPTLSHPIPADLFALALHDLPLDSVYAKTSELRNSLSHLHSSNDQLRPFAAAGDVDCAEAMAENEVVMKRMEERIELCAAEVERRGGVGGGGHGLEGKEVENGAGMRDGDAPTNGNGAAVAATSSGRLTDGELRRMLEARMAEDDAGARDGEEEEDGVHL